MDLPKKGATIHECSYLRRVLPPGELQKERLIGEEATNKERATIDIAYLEEKATTSKFR